MPDGGLCQGIDGGDPPRGHADVGRSEDATGSRTLIQINDAARLPPRRWRMPFDLKDGACHLIQDGPSTSKLPGSPSSFSAWLRSSSSCLPFGERSKQDEQITGDSMKAEG
jgi:hypothetical protein